MICPASVPVMVLLWPAAINATAKSMGARFPRKAGNSRCASFISATSELPVLKNTVAAKIKIAAFTKKARFNAMVVSIRLNFNSLFYAGISSVNFSGLYQCRMQV